MKWLFGAFVVVMLLEFITVLWIDSRWFVLEETGCRAAGQYVRTDILTNESHAFRIVTSTGEYMTRELFSTEYNVLVDYCQTARGAELHIGDHVVQVAR